MGGNSVSLDSTGADQRLHYSFVGQETFVALEIPVHTRHRHGSPTFYSLLQEMADVHDKKSHDYASNDQPYGNYHFAGKVAVMFAHSEQDAGFAGRLAEKMYRLANLEGSEKTPQNEAVEDTERDLAVIMTLWMADRRDRRAGKRVEVKA